MSETRRHEYRVTNRWTGNLGTGTSGYRAYSRDYEIGAPSKAAAIPGSSDPLFRGDSSRYNPEELLVGAVSACHMLWVLHWCADAGIVIREYVDQPVGELVARSDGSGEFTRVTLRPRMTIDDPTRAGDALEIHVRVHTVCAVARSLNFEVAVEPEIVSAG
jgi:organic hydroperoxide reductase OsmC/OhrA